MYIDMIFEFYGYIDSFFQTHLCCLVGCLSMIVWTHAVSGVLYTCVFIFLYLHLFSAIEHVSVQLSMFHMERCYRNTTIIIIVIILKLFDLYE